MGVLGPVLGQVVEEGEQVQVEGGVQMEVPLKYWVQGEAEVQLQAFWLVYVCYQSSELLSSVDQHLILVALFQVS